MKRMVKIMLKIRINGKELKSLMENATAAMMKKSSVPVLSHLLIETTEDKKFVSLQLTWINISNCIPIM